MSSPNTEGRVPISEFCKPRSETFTQYIGSTAGVHLRGDICNKTRRDFSDANLSQLGQNATTASIEQAKFATMEKRRYKDNESAAYQRLFALLDKEAVSILQATTSFKTEVDPEQDLFKLFDLLETNAKLKARKNPMMLGDRIRAMNSTMQGSNSIADHVRTWTRLRNEIVYLDAKRTAGSDADNILERNECTSFIQSLDPSLNKVFLGKMRDAYISDPDSIPADWSKFDKLTEIIILMADERGPNVVANVALGTTQRVFEAKGTSSIYRGKGHKSGKAVGGMRGKGAPRQGASERPYQPCRKCYLLWANHNIVSAPHESQDCKRSTETAEPKRQRAVEQPTQVSALLGAGNHSDEITAYYNSIMEA